jgi:RNA-directed DNA polymerase
LKHKYKTLIWNSALLLEYALIWLEKLKIRKGPANENSLWWIFLFDAKKLIKTALKDFIQGNYKFNPMNTYLFEDQELQKNEEITVFDYIDRLVLKWILKIIKPVFKHVIHFSCYHLQGPNAVKVVIQKTMDALKNKNFKYFIRADIKGYYASIDRRILTKQVEEIFDDIRLIKYLIDIINIPIIKFATFFTPDKGIPTRSSLSNFFSALYLKPLDVAFEKIQGVYYFRFVDDILILAETKRQYLKARKRLQKILSQLKLSLSKHKTKMGELKSGFHFLGIEFVAPQSQQVVQNQLVSTDRNIELLSVSPIALHGRSVRRSLDKVDRMEADAVNPADVQSYISKWARWWARVCSPKLNYLNCVNHWVEFSRKVDQFKPYAWLGSGLIAFR